MRNRPTTTTAALAGTACLLLLLGGCGAGTDDTTVVRDEPTGRPTATSTPTGSPAPASSPSVTATPSPAPGDASPRSATVAVYLTGATPQGLRLYREFRRVPAEDPLAAALAQLTAEPLDPDYRSLFPAGSFASATHDRDAGRVEVALVDDSWTTAPSGMDAAQARLAVQQLVHTAQAAVQERVPVVVTLDGEPTTLFGVETRDGVRQADPLDVLALVSVTAPEQGTTVEGSFRASGVASAFEATVPWEVRRGDEVVLEGFATAEGWMDRLYPWQSDEIDVSGLEPGSYTFVATTGDASAGEGPGPMQDSKEIQVR